MTRLKWKLVSVCLEIVLILSQDRCTFCSERTIGLKSFWSHAMELLVDVGHVKSYFAPFGERVLVSMQDRCMVCAERTTGSEIILDAHDGTDR
jgi:hypothetical protein